MSGPLVFAHHAEAGQLPTILTAPETQAQRPMPDFSYAGYEYGRGQIPVRGAVINVADFGAIADDGIDDSAAIRTCQSSAWQRSIHSD
ncbi:hypothetical protein [Erythrobacter longus]|uniref:hypothetical protein n=1 Tax=Erythrobacter longus TaxID=1044 RepID=UPI0012695818|nr:hypothetical protein [Erythrobacter longus]